MTKSLNFKHETIKFEDEFILKGFFQRKIKCSSTFLS